MVAKKGVVFKSDALVTNGRRAGRCPTLILDPRRRRSGSHGREVAALDGGKPEAQGEREPVP